MKRITDITRALTASVACSLTACSLTLLMAAGLASCANDDLAPAQPNPDTDAPFALTLNCVVGGKSTNPADTRATVDYGKTEGNGEAFRWNADDAFNAYLTDDNVWVNTPDNNALAPVRFNIDAKYADASSNSAPFSATFAVGGTFRMLALYPAIANAFTQVKPASTNGGTPDGANSATSTDANTATFAFAVPATGQTQTGLTTAHLRDNMLMWGTTAQPVSVGPAPTGSTTAPTDADATGTAPGFRFRHLTAMMRFTVKNKMAEGFRITAIRVKATGNIFGTEGTITQTATPWSEAPTVTSAADKAVDAISLATAATDDATKGISLSAATSLGAADGGSLDAYLLTLPGAALTGQKLVFTLTTTGPDGQNTRAYTSLELDADRIITANDGATTLEAGKRYWFDLSLEDQLIVSSFTVTPWADGTQIDVDNTTELSIAPEKGANGAPIYEIRTANALKAFADIINGTDDRQPRTFCGITIPGSSTAEAWKSNARLMADIDLSSLYGANIGDGGKSWTPIGTVDYAYKGVFDGNSHTVKGLYIKDERSDINADTEVCYGLFGRLDGATVQHLTVEGSITANLTATQGAVSVYIYEGGIAGLADGLTTLTDCHTAVQVAATGNNQTAEEKRAVYAGGIAGYIRGSVGSRLSNCSSTGVVTATASAAGSEYAYAGGICGYSNNTTLSGCSHTTGAVSATTTKGSTYAGGVVGSASTYGGLFQLLGCTNTAAVSGQAAATTSYSQLFIGGVAGISYLEIAACSNSGAITYNAKSNLYAGGVVGNSQKTVISSFSTQVPTVSAGGSKGTYSYIGGVIGSHTSNTTLVSTCFYVSGSTDGMGTNGIGSIGAGSDIATTNTDGGILATLAALNAKAGAMNTAIGTYNATTTTGNPCPYYWIKANAAPQLRKK